jgi:hypothetical protein
LISFDYLDCHLELTQEEQISAKWSEFFQHILLCTTEALQFGVNSFLFLYNRISTNVCQMVRAQESMQFGLNCFCKNYFLYNRVFLIGSNFFLSKFFSSQKQFNYHLQFGLISFYENDFMHGKIQENLVKWLDLFPS